MQVTLMGPDDLGHWFLTDSIGREFPLVNRWEDHVSAATLFGWKAPVEVGATEVIEDALAWLMDRIGEEIGAPLEVVRFFAEESE